MFLVGFGKRREGGVSGSEEEGVYLQTEKKSWN